MEQAFKTSDLYMAGYIQYKGIPLLGCVPSGEAGRNFFVFSYEGNREAIDKAVEEWVTGTGDAAVAKRYNAAAKACRFAVHNPVIA